MIPKGNQRGGGQQLATHLLNSYDNELIEVAELRDAIASDLHGAFAEWRAQAKATKCRKYLYSLSINPDHRQGPFAREQYYDFIVRVEKKLKLENQPRAVVFHTKQGRAHCHVVWSRIDTAKMKAVHLSNDRQSLRTVAQEFAKDHGITLPAAMRKNRGKDRFKDREKREELSDKQQQERSGLTKQEHKDAITALWKENGTGKSFVQALEASGYYLARGDKDNPTYVVIDSWGEVHSLARRIEEAKTKEIKARLVGYPIEQLRSVTAAKEFAQEQRDRKLQALPAPSKEADGVQNLETRRQELTQRQQARREALRQKRTELERKHTSERNALAELQDGEIKGALGARAAKQPKGIVGFLARITGIRALVAMQEKKQDQQRGVEHVRQRQALFVRHERERQDFSRHESALTRVEKRENRSFRTALRREQFNALARPGKAPAPQLTAEQQQKIARAREVAQKFNQAAHGQHRTPQVTAEQRAAIEAYKRDRQGTVAPIFNKAASDKGRGKPPSQGPEKSAPNPPPSSDTLTAAFTKSAHGTDEPKTGDSKDVKNGHAGGTEGGEGGLSEAFRKAQEQKLCDREDERIRKARDRDRGRDR